MHVASTSDYPFLSTFYYSVWRFVVFCALYTKTKSKCVYVWLYVSEAAAVDCESWECGCISRWRNVGRLLGCVTVRTLTDLRNSSRSHTTGWLQCHRLHETRRQQPPCEYLAMVWSASWNAVSQTVHRQGHVNGTSILARYNADQNVNYGK